MLESAANFPPAVAASRCILPITVGVISRTAATYGHEGFRRMKFSSTQLSYSDPATSAAKGPLPWRGFFVLLIFSSSVPRLRLVMFSSGQRRPAVSAKHGQDVGRYWSLRASFENTHQRAPPTSHATRRTRRDGAHLSSPWVRQLPGHTGCRSVGWNISQTGAGKRVFRKSGSSSLMRASRALTP